MPPSAGGAERPRSAGSLPGRAGSARGAAVRSQPAVSSLLSAPGPGQPSHARPWARLPPHRCWPPLANQCHTGGPRCPPGRAAEQDPLPVSLKHLGRESPSRFSRPRAGVNHAPARRQGQSRRHTLGTGGTRRSQGCPQPPFKGVWECWGQCGPQDSHAAPKGQRRTQGLAQPCRGSLGSAGAPVPWHPAGQQQPTPGRPSSHQHGHGARDPALAGVRAGLPTPRGPTGTPGSGCWPHSVGPRPGTPTSCCRVGATN